MASEQFETVDLTPTWSTIGAIYARLAESGEVKACAAYRSEAMRAFAMAQALAAIFDRLPEDLAAEAREICAREVKK